MLYPMCAAVAMSVCFGKEKKQKKIFFGGWSCVPCLLQVSLCVCLGLTQLIQCREYRFAVKVSTCNNLPSKKIKVLLDCQGCSVLYAVTKAQRPVLYIAVTCAVRCCHQGPKAGAVLCAAVVCCGVLCAAGCRHQGCAVLCSAERPNGLCCVVRC
mgnify:FL=1